jgi:hypothetical protein
MQAPVESMTGSGRTAPLLSQPIIYVIGHDKETDRTYT